jgi:hypothetical protein
VLTAAYAASVRALAAVLVTLNEQVKALQGHVETQFGQHLAAEIIASQPGLGPVPYDEDRLVASRPEPRGLTLKLLGCLCKSGSPHLTWQRRPG